ncbi:MAG: NAD(P)-dependent oxidoreductase [Opitutaceae bacterium]|nr:NAD(P)-dependent oxidoreductase [Opitutaceae bacterium]
MATCLITGGAGNLASQLSWSLAGRYDRVVLIDVAPAPVAAIAPGAVFERGDLLDAVLRPTGRPHNLSPAVGGLRRIT